MGLQAYGTACKLNEMPAIPWNCMQPCVTLGNLWQPNECTQTEFNCITLLFHGFDLLTVNILEHF